MTEDLARLYLKTLVTIEEHGRLVDAGKAEMVRQGVAHVITAWNPGNLRPTPEENAAANDRLRSTLESLGLHPVRAVGSDPDSPHLEESWAVVGLSDVHARTLGAEFGQVAVFRLEPGSQTVLGCLEDWQLTRRL